MLSARDKELFKLCVGLGGRPLKSFGKSCCWKVRVNVFLGVVGGAGVKLDSLPFKDEAKLVVEPAPFCSIIYFYF